jgi:hypothetical protein
MAGKNLTGYCDEELSLGGKNHRLGINHRLTNCEAVNGIMAMKNIACCTKHRLPEQVREGTDIAVQTTAYGFVGLLNKLLTLRGLRIKIEDGFPRSGRN